MTDVATLGFQADSRSLRVAANDLDRVSASAKRTETATQRLERQTTAAFRALQVGFAGYGFARVTQQIIQINDEFARIEGRLKLVTSGTAELNKVQDELFASAQRTGTAYSAVAELYTRVAQNTKDLGLSQKELLQFTETTSQAFQVSGASAAESAGAIRQLTQALASGVFRGEEFNSVAEQGPRILQALSDSLGKSRGELREMAEQGELTARVVLDAMSAQADGIAKEFSALPVTVGRAMTELENEVKRAIAGADTGPLVESIRELKETLSDPAIVEGLSTIAAALVSLASGSAKAATAFAEFGTEIGETFGAISQYNAIDQIALIGWMINPTTLPLAISLLSDTREKTNELFEAMGGPKASAAAKELERILNTVKDPAWSMFGDAASVVGIYADETTMAARAADAQKIAEKAKADALEKSRIATEAAQKASAENARTIAETIKQLEDENKLLADGISLEEARLELSLRAIGADDGQIARIKALTKEQERLTTAVDTGADSVGELGEAYDASAEQMARAYERAAEGIEGVFRDLYRSAFDGFEGFEDRLKDSFKDLLVELALIATRNAIIIPVVTQLGSAAGLSQQAIGSITGALGLGDQSGLGAIFNAQSFASFGDAFFENGILPLADVLGEAGFEDLAVSVTNLGANVSSLASSIPLLGAAAGGLFAAGNALTVPGSNFSGAEQGVAAIATFGYSLWISAFDSVAGGNLFGTKWKTAGQTLAINIQDDIADATLTTIRSRKRPLGGGTKRRTSTDDVTALDDQINDVFGGIYDSVSSALDDIGIQLGEFDFEISLDTKGKTEEEINELITGAITSATNALMLEAIPSLERFQQVGEELADTFNRVVSGARTVQTAIELFDLNSMVPFLGQRELVFEFNDALGLWTATWRDSTQVVEASEAQILEVSNALTLLAGSAEQLQANTSGFFNAFATDAQKFDAQGRLVANLFGELGIAIPDSGEALFDLVHGINIFTEEGQRAYNALTAAHPLLQEFFGTIEEFAADAYDIRTRLGLNDGLDPLRDALEAVGISFERVAAIADRKNPLAVIGRLLGGLDDAQLASLGPFIDDILNLVTGVTEAGQNAGLAAAESDLMRAYEMESAALRTAAEAFQSIVDDLTDFQDELRFGPLARLTPQNQYAAESDRFREVSALARSGDQDALAQLPEVARAFLEASQANFATSTRYFNDLAMVNDVIGDSIGTAGNEVDIYQRQLDQMTAQVSQLISLNDTTLSVKDAIERLIQAQGGEDAKTLKQQDSKNLAALTNSQTEMNKRMDKRMQRIEADLDQLAQSSRLESARA